MSNKTATKNTNRSKKNGRNSGNTNSSRQNKSTPNARNGSAKIRGQSPAVVAGVARSQRIQIMQAPVYTMMNGSTRICHRELISSVTPLISSTFEVIKRLRINPGSVKTFPWLSTIANTFETYKFHKLHFHYVTRCSTQNVGSILMVPDYDAADKSYSTETEAAQNVDSVEDSVWQSIVCRADPSKMNRAFKSHFCMSDSRFGSTKQDIKTVDAGQFFLIVDGGVANTTLGKLWVEYDVSLQTPQVAESALNEGGSGTRKLVGFQTNTSSVFADRSVSDFFQETVDPILEQLPATSFPGQNLFKVLRDWEGYIDSAVKTTAAMTTSPKPTVNGIAMNVNTSGFKETLAGMKNAASTEQRFQYHGVLKEGDLLGFSQVDTAGSITELIMNLGASGVL